MKNRPANIASLYLRTWWFPAALYLAALAFLAVLAWIPWISGGFLADTCLLSLAVLLLGVLAASLWNLLRKRWLLGVVNFLMVPLCLIASAFALAPLMFAAMFGPSEDGFADNLTIPSGIAITEPKEELEGTPGGLEDAFQQKLLAALQDPESEDLSIKGDIDPLLKMQREHKDSLMRYLATSPSWRVYKENGARFATRRWMVGAAWRYDLNGYYTRHNIDRWEKAGIPDFQARLSIGFSGRPWWRGNEGTTIIQPGQRATVALSIGNQMHQSHCVILAGDLAVEIFEQSATRTRRLTRAALEYLNDEIRSISDSPDWHTIKTLVPSGSILHGAPSIELRKSFQPGIYDSEIRVNPGEPGMIYLKAFEVTRGIRLSEDRLMEASNEWVGWSNDPTEMFFSNTTFTIYEGDWGKPYAARFEVWFIPDSGSPERKLIDRVFKIEGWQR